MKIEVKTSRKSIKKWIIIVSSVFILFGYNQAAIAAEITAQKMIELTNESREASGLLPLKVNDKLTAAAEAKADDMFRFQYFDHNSPSGVTPWYWIKSAGYDYLYAGENLAIDFITAEGTHMALMRSITHRDNILKPNYTEVGIAVKKGIFDGNESIIIVEEFGTPLRKENLESEINIRGDVDINSRENKTEEIKKELVEIKSPIVYFKDENYKEGENKTETGETEKTIIEKINEEFVLPIMLPAKNIKPLEETYTENIFWESYEEEGAVDNLKAMINDYLRFLNI